MVEMTSRSSIVQDCEDGRDEDGDVCRAQVCEAPGVRCGEAGPCLRAPHSVLCQARVCILQEIIIIAQAVCIFNILFSIYLFCCL